MSNSQSGKPVAKVVLNGAKLEVGTREMTQVLAELTPQASATPFL